MVCVPVRADAFVKGSDMRTLEKVGTESHPCARCPCIKKKQRQKMCAYMPSPPLEMAVTPSIVICRALVTEIA